MNSGPDALRTFFARKEPWNASAPWALDALEPFSRMADEGRYGLIHGSLLNVSDVCAALWLATGADAKGIVQVPNCTRMVKPPWLDTPAEAEAVQPPVLMDGLHALLAAHRMTMPTADAEALQIAFEASLGEKLRGALFRSLTGSRVVRDDAWCTLRVTLLTYVRLSLHGSEAAGRVAPLLRVLENAIPLRPMPHRPRIWYVLTR